MTKEIIEYVVRFESWSHRNPLTLSVEGGAALQRLLIDRENCPKFVKIFDDTVNTNEIGSVDAVYARPPEPHVEPRKPMTPEQLAAHEKRMAEFRDRFGLKLGKP